MIRWINLNIDWPDKLTVPWATYWDDMLPWHLRHYKQTLVDNIFRESPIMRYLNRKETL